MITSFSYYPLYDFFQSKTHNCETTLAFGFHRLGLNLTHLFYIISNAGITIL